MTNFSFKNRSNSLGGNTFQEWVESFKADWNHFVSAFIVAVADSDRYTKGAIVDRAGVAAIYPNDAATRLNFQLDKKLWGRYNKALFSVDKAGIKTLLSGEVCTLEAVKYSLVGKLVNIAELTDEETDETIVPAGQYLIVKRAYKSGETIIQHATGMMIPCESTFLQAQAEKLHDPSTAKPAKLETKAVVDLSDFD